MQHHPWEEVLLQEGWEARASQHVSRTTGDFVYEVQSVSNFEECIIDLNIRFRNGLVLSEAARETAENTLHNYFARFFESEEGMENWGWHEDGAGLEVFDIGESYEQLGKFMEKESELLRILRSHANAN